MLNRLTDLKERIYCYIITSRIWRSLPMNVFDFIIFTAVSLYLHYNEICWIGFCYDHHNHHKFNSHNRSLASFTFLTAMSLLASQYKWWPTQINFQTCLFVNALYKVWIGALVHNFSERLLWNALYESFSYILQGVSFSIVYIVKDVLNQEKRLHIITNGAEYLKCDVVHHLCLLIISLWILVKLLNKRGIFNQLYSLLPFHGNDGNLCKKTSSQSLMQTALNPLYNIIERKSATRKSKSRQKCKPRRKTKCNLVSDDKEEPSTSSFHSEEFSDSDESYGPDDSHKDNSYYTCVDCQYPAEWPCECEHCLVRQRNKLFAP